MTRLLWAVCLTSWILCGCSEESKDDESDKKQESKGDGSDKQRIEESGFSISDFPALPGELREKGVMWPIELSALEQRHGKAAEDQRGQWKVYDWKEQTINGCKNAHITASFRDADSSLVVRLDDCPLELLDIVQTLGHCASPPDEEMIWLFSDALVKFDGFRKLTIEMYVGKYSKLKDKHDVLPAAYERMQEPTPRPNFDTATPEKDLKTFVEALKSINLYLAPALAYPFSADGKILDDVGRFKKINSKFDGNKPQQITENLALFDVCESTDWQKIQTGEPFRGKTWDAEEFRRYYRKLPGVTENGDLLIKCYKKNSGWEGFSVTYRKVGDRWRPSGYLD